MKKAFTLLVCFCLTLLLFACANKDDDPVENLEDIEETIEDGEIEEVLEIQEDAEEMKEIDNETFIEVYNQFSVSLLKNAYKKNDNEIISPLSLYNALAVLGNGAAGKTRKQIEEVLGLKIEEINRYMYDMEMNRSEWDAAPYFKINALWFNTAYGLELKEDFKKNVNYYYENGIEEYDFKDGSGLANKANNWAADNTENTIDHVIDAEDVDSNTAFLIMNALVTGDKWMFQFDPNDTRSEVFHTYKGEEKLVDMMHQTFYGYWHDDKSQGFAKVLENDTHFIGILPNEGIDVYDFIKQLDYDTILNYVYKNVTYTKNYREGGDWGCKYDEYYTNLSFPKFIYEKEYDLNQVMADMGLADLFDYRNCDFSAMAQGDQKLIDAMQVDAISQKANIEVNEQEAKAAAVSVVRGGYGAGGCEVDKEYYMDVVFDRPFIFAFFDGELPLFIGVVSDIGVKAENITKLQNIIGVINIRKGPGTSYEKVSKSNKGDILFAFEKRENEGYTWYRIGEDQWIADDNGKWLKIISE